MGCVRGDNEVNINNAKFVTTTLYSSKAKVFKNLSRSEIRIIWLKP